MGERGGEGKPRFGLVDSGKEGYRRNDGIAFRDTHICIRLSQASVSSYTRFSL